MAILQGLEMACAVKDCCDSIAAAIGTVIGYLLWALEAVLTCFTGREEFLKFFNFEVDPAFQDSSLPLVHRWKTNSLGSGLAWITSISYIVCCFLARVNGRPEVFEKGVDSWGNVCGSNQSPLAASNYSSVLQLGYGKVFALPMIDKNTFKKPLEYSGDKITLCLKNCPTETLVTSKGTCKLFFADPEVTKYPAALIDDICADSSVADFGMSSGTYFNDTVCSKLKNGEGE